MSPWPPCDTCLRERCPYCLFIDCPTWQEWAAEKNREEEEDNAD